MANNEAVEAVLKARYYQPGETDWLDICIRVCDYITGNGGEDKEEKYQRYLDVMKTKQFIPNSPVLFNFGTKTNQGAACFVLGVADNMDSIYTTLHRAAKIFKSGGGVGINYSPLRPAGSSVKETNGVASGVVSFMKLYDASTEVIKAGGCVDSNTRVQTSKGYVKIGEFVNCSPFGDNEINKIVLDKDGMTYAYLSQDNGIADVISISSKHGYSIKCTPNHKLRVVNINGEFDWKDASDITTDDYLIIRRGENTTTEYVDLPQPMTENRHFNTRLDITVPRTLDEDLAFLIGMYMGNGNLSKTVFAMCIGDLDAQLTTEFLRIMKKFNLNVSSSTKPNDKSTNYHCGSLVFSDWWRSCGFSKNGSPNAFVPESIFKSPESVVCAFLRGLFSCDGHVNSEQGYPQIGVTSKQLIEDCQLLLQSIGIISQYTCNTKANSLNSYGKLPIHCLRVCDEIGISKFSGSIGFVQTRKQSKIKLDTKCQSQIVPHVEKLLEKYHTPTGDPKMRKEILRYIRGDRHPTRSKIVGMCLDHNAFSLDLLTEDLLGEEFAYSKVTNISPGRCYTVDIETGSHEYVANGICVHNKRRGAAIAILDVNHPEIEDFITCKDVEGGLTNFNISVLVTDAFLDAVNNNKDWDLVFEGKVYKTVKARDLYNKICKSVWTRAEPGIIYYENMNKDNTSSNPINTTNPCGELGLEVNPETLCGESCNLGSINLVAMLKDGKIDYELLRETTRTAVDFLNDVIDKNEYPLPEIEEMTKSNRRIGLGIMGFADVLITYGLRYDNTPETLELINNIMFTIRDTADKRSEELAKESGGYPNQKAIEKPIRNATRLAIAPTGTISMIAGVSSGIEPNFAYVYDRKNSIGTYLQVHEQFEKDLRKERIASEGKTYEYIIKRMHETGTIQDIVLLSDEFKNKYVTATDVTPEAHIAIQSQFQKYVDSSISKTINCPESTTVTDIEGYIMSAWKQGIKGLTFYRQNSREDVVLNLAKSNEPSGMETAEEYIKSEESRIKGEFKHIPQECPTGGYTSEEVEKVAFKRPKTLYGKTTQLESGCGRLYITLNYNRGKLYEILIKTAGGGCEASIDAMARMISTNMRNGVPIEQITKQLCKVKCVVAMKKKCDGKSCADVIGKLIKESNLPEFPDSSNPTNKSYLTVAPNSSVFPNSSTTIATSHPYDNTKIYTTSGINTIPNSTYNAKTNIMTINSKNHCPDCGAPIHKSEGCVICSSCGWSRC